MSRTGGCLCGAVRYEVSSDVKTTGACHCTMCQRFSGGVYLAFQVGKDAITFTKDDGLATYKSSDWAERGFCSRCGSSLFYRVTAPGMMEGQLHMGLGTLDDASGIELDGEIYADRKPEGYAFAGDHNRMTEAETAAFFTKMMENAGAP